MADQQGDLAPAGAVAAAAQNTASTTYPQIPPPGPYDFKSSPADWKIWKQTWNNYQIISRLTRETEDFRVAFFLHTIGPEALNIYNNMSFREGEDKNKLEDIIKKFDEFIIGETNETYERYLFNRREQQEGENTDTYVTALRNLAKTCGFCDCLHDSLLRDRIVLGVQENATRKHLLQERKLTLSAAIDICKSRELTSTHMKALSGQ